MTESEIDYAVDMLMTASDRCGGVAGEDAMSTGSVRQVDIKCLLVRRSFELLIKSDESLQECE